MQFAIGEKDVELDRMKTTIIALNEKLIGLQDVRADVILKSDTLKESE